MLSTQPTIQSHTHEQTTTNTTAIEKEIKTALTKEMFDLLCQHFNVKQTVPQTQENFYFDTPDKQLGQQKIGLRIRFEDTFGELTLKTPHQQNEMIETTTTFIKNDTVDYAKKPVFPMGDVSTLLQQRHICLDQLQCIGTLVNKRYTVVVNDGIFALDESHFKSGVTYELEFEYEQNDVAFWRLLQQFNIPFQTLPSKLVRAIES